MPWSEFLALRKNILRQERADQEYEAWLNDKLNEWLQIPKEPIDDEDNIGEVAAMAKAQSMRHQLLAQERAV